MYEERLMNHLPLNCEGQVLVNLMEGWRRDKDIMSEVSHEGWKPLIKGRKANPSHEKRERQCKDLFRFYNYSSIADILGISESTVHRHLNNKAS